MFVGSWTGVAVNSVGSLWKQCFLVGRLASRFHLDLCGFGLFGKRSKRKCFEKSSFKKLPVVVLIVFA